MRTLIPLLLGLAAVPIAIASDDDPSVVNTRITRSAVIEIGPALVTFAPVPPRPPFVIGPGTHLQLKVRTPDGSTPPSVTWFKDGRQLASTDVVLDIPRASAADTGNYSATIPDYGAVRSFASDTAGVLVVRDAQRMLNVSNRARISGEQRTAITGFVVEHGPSFAHVLIRGVGPTLARFGVTDPLPEPHVRVFDAAGREILPVSLQPIEGVPPPDIDEAARQVGAFPLAPNSRDYARLFYLPAGAYTAHLTSGDGTPGTALLEVYQVK